MDKTDKKFLSVYIKSQLDSLINVFNGRPYVLSTYYFPSEMACLFDVEIIYIERIVGLAAGMNMLDQNKESPLDQNICSYQKAFVKLIEKKVIPKPDMIIAVRYPCKDAVALCDYLHDTYEIPIYHISLGQLKKDFQDIYYILSNKYKLKRDIREISRLSNEASELKEQIDHYRIQYPGIIRSEDCLKIFPIENDFGKESAVNVLKVLLNCIKDNIPSYEQKNVTNIFWMGLIPLIDNSMLSRLEKVTNCRFVFEEMWMFGSYKFDDSDFYDSLVMKIKQTLFYSIEDRIQKIHEVVKRTDTKGIMNLCQLNCSFLPKTIYRFEEYFTNISVPFFNGCCDVVMDTYDMKPMMEFINKLEGNAYGRDHNKK